MIIANAKMYCAVKKILPVEAYEKIISNFKVTKVRWKQGSVEELRTYIEITIHICMS